MIMIALPTHDLGSLPAGPNLFETVCPNSSVTLCLRSLQFFPDRKESVLARRGTFEGTPFKIDFLTNPGGLSDIGWEKKVKMTDRVQPADEARARSRYEYSL
jgi:hypothetical protein